MMKEKDLKNFMKENFYKETTNDLFTANALDKIAALQKEKETIQPLIPKKWMYTICTIYFFAFVIPVLLFVKELDFSFLSEYAISGLSLGTAVPAILTLTKLAFAFTLILLGEKLLSKKLFFTSQI